MTEDGCEKMNDNKIRQQQRNEVCIQRHELTIERMKQMMTEDTVEKQFQPYFQECALFLLELEMVRKKVEDGSWENLSLAELRSITGDYMKSFFQKIMRKVMPLFAMHVMCSERNMGRY